MTNRNRIISMRQTLPPNPLLCRYFPSPSGCFRGDRCAYRHEQLQETESESLNTPDHENATSKSKQSPHRTTSTETQNCIFHSSNGGCRNGSFCKFTHSSHTRKSDSNNDSDSDVHLFSDSDHGLKKCNEESRKIQIQDNPALHRAKMEVIGEIVPVLTRELMQPFFAIDVECVATGVGNEDRDVARIAVVNEEELVFFDQYVLPDKPIISYLTPLTGIAQSHLVGAPSLQSTMIQLRSILPSTAVIVGQSIKKDLKWLGLEKGKDYTQSFDVADLFRIPMQSMNGTIRYQNFSLRHVAKYLLSTDIQEADHNPVIDAKYAMKVFKQFRHLHESPAHRDAVFQTLLKTPRTPSFAERFPTVDGVSMKAPRNPNYSSPYQNT